jgi:hypothetical protein
MKLNNSIFSIQTNYNIIIALKVLSLFQEKIYDDI